LLAPDMMRVSSDFRMIALIVILLRAGFELRRDTLNRVGGAALTMSCVPALFEIAAVTVLGPVLLGLGWLESALLGCILGAVSPAVVVPLMIDLMERGKGEDKGIPTLILAASSIDDVFVIVIFSIVLGMAGGGEVNWLWQLGSIPVSIVLGIIAGLIPGYFLYRLFLRYDFKPPRRTIIVLGAAIGLLGLEDALRGVVPVAGLLGVMAIGFIILEKEEAIAHIISAKLKRLWVFAELLLFVLVGAQVDVQVAWRAGLAGTLLIVGGLAARSLGTYLSLAGTPLTRMEKLFAVVAYVPKATVQAAIGAAPLAAGVAGGEVILAVAVLSILLTAPIGAVGIKVMGESVLAEGRRPAYRFKDLRERLGLPRVGERLRRKADGTVWKVIEEKESWHNGADPATPARPMIELRIWRLRDGQPPGTGATKVLAFAPESRPFDEEWEIVYD
ncbi:MAG TPA: cation:proton antiporter, partial [Methylomirabilota bacterium]|nr:cation:proton antiporter [Methylomirabilota bacterium]